MKIILISHPSHLPNEIQILNSLFELELDYFHMLKAGFTLEDTEMFVRAIKPQYVKRIILHNHFKLINKYNLAGIHLHNMANGEKEEDLKLINKMVSSKRIKICTTIYNTEDIPNPKVKFSYIIDNSTPSLSIEKAEELSSKTEVFLKKNPQNSFGNLPPFYTGIALSQEVWQEPELVPEKFTAFKSRGKI